jgi:UPF0176 protein
MSEIQIITFYEFKPLKKLDEKKIFLKRAMQEHSVSGTIILAEEGFNSTVAGCSENIQQFIRAAEKILETELKYKSSFHDKNPFRRILVKVKPEIVTLRKNVEIERGIGTHVSPQNWNKIITDAEVFLLDVRNDYEHKAGTFRGAINPKTRKFSELPRFVEENLSPEKHKKVAMFCTGGIRCEKFAAYLKEIGFENVYQLEGGILKYLEEIPPEESLWEGECFVFDDRITVNKNLRKGTAEDFSFTIKAE